jgi:outer membrane lipoprotein
MKQHLQSLALIITAALLQACATTPAFDTSGIDLAITPQQAAARADSLAGSRVLWGGVIIASTNLKDASQLEILAYPLTSNQHPDIDQPPLGRFLARKDGYLETADYSQGRLITLSGTLHNTREGRIGESEYTYPLVQMDQSHLWPRTRRTEPETRFHFGIGVIFSN